MKYKICKRKRENMLYYLMRKTEGEPWAIYGITTSLKDAKETEKFNLDDNNRLTLSTCYDTMILKLLSRKYNNGKIKDV